MIKYLKLIGFILVAAIVFIFFYCNIGNGTLLYPAHFEFSIPPLLKLESKPIPLGILLIFAFFAGMFISALLGLYQSILTKFSLHGKQKKIKKLEKKVKELENKFPSVEHFPRPVPAIEPSRIEPARKKRPKPQDDDVDEAEFDDEHHHLFEAFRRDFK